MLEKASQSKCGETNIQISVDRYVHIYYPTMFQIYLPPIKRIYEKEKKIT